MNIDLFYNVNIIYSEIKLIKEKQIKLINLKDKIVKMLDGHVEIPEEKIFNVFRDIDELNKCLDENIKKGYKKISEL